MPRRFPVGEIKFEMRRLTPRFVRLVWKDLQEDDCVDLAAQMSFYFVMSLFPFLVVIGALVGRLPSSNLWPDMVQWLTYYLPRGSRRLVIETIFDLTTYRNQFFSYGLAATMWIASS